MGVAISLLLLSLLEPIMTETVVIKWTIERRAASKNDKNLITSKVEVQ